MWNRTFLLPIVAILAVLFSNGAATGPRVSISGKQIRVHGAAPGSNLELYEGTTPLASGRADSAGDAEFPHALPSGTAPVRVVEQGTGRTLGAPTRFHASVAADAFSAGAQLLASGIRPSVTTIADLDGDGAADLILAGENEISVVRPSSPPRKLPGVPSPVAILAHGRDLLVADASGLLLAISSDGASRRMSIGGRPVALATLDLDQDGIPDLAVADASGDILLLRGYPGGAFAVASRFAAARSPLHLAAADFNGDGIADLALTDSVDNTAVTWIGNGKAAFHRGASLRLGARADSLLAADLDGNGYADLAIAGDAAELLLNDGAGGFRSEALGRVHTLAAADFDDDGRLDLLLQDETGAVRARLSSGKAFASTAQPLGVLAAADFDGDGVPDAAIVDLAGSVSLVSGVPAPRRGRPGSALVDSLDALRRRVGGLLPRAAASTTVTLATSGSPSVFGSPVTLTATVTPSNATGRVTFYDGFIPIGTGSVSGGHAAMTTVLLPSGARSLTARFIANTNYATSVSSSTTQTVNMAGAATYSSVVGYGSVSGPEVVIVTDMNNDGIPDIVSGAISGDIVAVFLGNGDGTFQSQLNTAVNSAWGIAAADFNGDGNQDLAVTSWVQSGKVYILLGDGEGGFTSTTSKNVGTAPRDVKVGDFNNDGKADLVVVNDESDNVSVLLGNGDGTFASAVNYDVGINPECVAVADVSGDGREDLIVTNNFETFFSVLTGNSNGTFDAATSVTIQSGGQGIGAADFNGDGKTDLAIANFYNDRVHVLTGKGGSLFNSPVNLASETENQPLALGDVNGDGKIDILTSTSYSGNAAIFLGNGNGTFQARSTVGSMGGGGIAVGDFNGDGYLDIVTGSSGAGKIKVAISSSPADLRVAKSHSGYVWRGQTGATYTIDVWNGGGQTTSGTVTVADTLPSGLTATAISGTGWNCTLATLTCTTSTTKTKGSHFNAITVTVNVSGSAASSVTNSVTVSGGGESNTSNDTATDPTTVLTTAPSDLRIAKSHSGNFYRNLTGASYSIDVWNAGPAATSATVTVVDTLPSGLTATAIAGTGWSCTLATLTCTRSDALSPSAHYPAIAVTVNVSGSAAATVTNSVTVSGGGDIDATNNTDTDPTTVSATAPTDLVVTSTHTGNFPRGQGGSTYTLDVYNTGGVASSGTVTVVDTLPTGITATALSGTGWNCTLATLTCTRSTVLNAASHYPAITVTVDVAGNTASSVTNTVTVSGGGDGYTGNNTGFDPTTTTAPSVHLAGSGSPTQYGQLVTFTATFGAAVSGRVLFYDNGVLVESAAINGTSVAYKTSQLPPGSHTITASFGADSATISQTVTGVDITAGWGKVYHSGTGGVAALTLADMNQDGKPDLVYLTGSTVLIFPGNGDGTFASASSYNAGGAVNDLMVDDLNGDGYPDVATANATANTMSVFLNNGSGGLNSATNYTAGNYVYDVASGDLNLDGIPDLVCINRFANTLGIFIGSGDGTFGAMTTVAAATNGEQVLIRDLDGDGKPDVVLESASNVLQIFRGNGDGTITLENSYSTGNLTKGLVVADLNGDGKLDIALAYSNLPAQAQIFLGNGDRTFTLKGSYGFNAAGTQNPKVLVTGDFNNDGKPDLATGSGNTGGVDILFGNGDGSFGNAINIGQFTNFAIGVGELNGDGRVDLIGGVLSGGGYSVYLALGDGVYLSASPTPSSYNQSVTLTASVIPSNSTGTVTFYDGSTSIGTGTISSGAATLSVSNLAVGSHTLKATYAAFTSANLSHTVNKASATVALGSLSQTYDGNPKSATATTTPSGLTVNFTYNSSSTPPTNAGPYTVVGTISDANYQGSTSNTLNIAKASQTITFTQPDDVGFPSSPVTLSATASSSLTVTFTSNSTSVCTVSGSTVTIVATGTCSITASQAGNTNYNLATSVTRTFNVTTASSQTITFPTPSDVTFGVSPFSLSATASSSLTVSFSSNSTGVCTVSGSTVTIVGGGTCSITASQSGNGSYSAATPVTRTFTVNPASQTINFPTPSDVTFGVSPVSLSATASSTLAVTFASNSTSFCTVSGSTVTIVAGGTCSITASQSGNASYSAATPVTRTFTVNATSQTITFPTPSDVTFGVSPYSLSASASSSLAVTFASNSTSVCTVSGSTVTIVAGGTCSITASQSGNASYSAATPVTRTFTVNATSQTITFPTPSDVTFGVSPYSLSASASSSLAVTFASNTTGVCTVSGSTITIVAGGTCSITASQSGNASYSAATPVTRTFTVNATSQTITFPTPSDVTFGVSPYSPSASASSSLAVTFASNTTAVCTVAGSTVTIVAAGTCSITASQSGNASYTAATPVTRTFTVNPASQTITFPTPSDVSFPSSPFTLSATASSSLTVTFASNSTSVCTVSGTTVTIVGAGACSITASQAGNANYNAASPVTRTFNVGAGIQTITFTAPSDVTFGVSPFPISATASSSLTVSFASNTTAVCTVSGTTVTIVGGGTCSITATQAGNGSYSAATPVTRTFTVNPASQTVTFAALPDVPQATSPFGLSATASSTLPVTFSSTTTGVCTVSGSTVTIVGPGICSIVATQAGNANYSAASLTRSFNVTIAVTVKGNTPGPSFSVDGTTYTTPQTFQWISGSAHTIAAPVQQSGGTGVRYNFGSWSDTGAQSHSVAPASASAYTVTFVTQFLLSTSVLPAGAGSVTVNPTSPDGYYDSGTPISIAGVPGSGAAFNAFGGDLLGVTNPQTLTISHPSTVTANFIPPSPAVAISVANKVTNAGVCDFDLIVRNNGVGDATDVTINSMPVSVLVGSGSVALTSPTVPVLIGNIPAGAAVTVHATVTLTGTVTRFRITQTGTMKNTAGSVLALNSSQTIFP